MLSRSRQVNENWIQIYRGWVYGAGFGAELGFGISTIITTSLVHVMIAAMVLSGSFTHALVIGLTFGTARGATMFAARRVEDPAALRALHRRLDELRTRARSGAIAALALVGTLGATAVLL